MKRKITDSPMEAGSESLKKLLEEVDDGVYFTDRQRKITFWNKGAERISGFSKDDVLGKKCSDNILIHVDQQGRSLCSGMCPLAKTLLDRQNRLVHIFLHHREGHRVPVRVRVFPILDKKQQVIGAAELFSDSSEKMDLRSRLEEFRELAMFDPLTGVFNRRSTENTLYSRLEELKRFDWPFGIIFFDIDDFKAVNDDYSHSIGDMVLKMTVNTLQKNIRSIDQIGRWGGEEFIVILRNTNP
ncbi:MAG TPA: diguanylate cyclase, partial [Candidatus Binatia bacterium]|nr:diguanylate cyclase [Candidatus Binatia bacterium]